MGAGLVERPMRIRPTETITVYHVTWHAPFASPGNDEADILAEVQWLERVPTNLSGKELAQWLHRRLLDVGQKTMWYTMKAWGSPVTLAQVQKACEICVVYS